MKRKRRCRQHRKQSQIKRRTKQAPKITAKTTTTSTNRTTKQNDRHSKLRKEPVNNTTSRSKRRHQATQMITAKTDFNNNQLSACLEHQSKTHHHDREGSTNTENYSTETTNTTNTTKNTAKKNTPLELLGLASRRHVSSFSSSGHRLPFRLFVGQHNNK